MDLLPGERPRPPPVEVLVERVGGESAENDDQPRETKLAASFAKYKSLEDTTFAIFEYDRFDHLLHFHLESHDRCDVRLKPLLWDKNAYFRPELMKEGVLRLVPHFIPTPSREDAPRKRRILSPPVEEPTIESPRSQKKRPETWDPRIIREIAKEEELIAEEHYEIVTAAPSKHIQRNLSDQDYSASRVVDSLPEDTTRSSWIEDAELTAEQDHESAAVQPPAHNRGKVYDHGYFTPRAPHTVSPLPENVTHSSWIDDFLAAKQRYVDAHVKGGIVFAHSTTTASSAAHLEMITGKYGMTALRSCDRCVKDGFTCLVYHGECYEWHNPSVSTVKLLGWRCARCRKGWQVHGGCNAQHVR